MKQVSENRDWREKVYERLAKAIAAYPGRFLLGGLAVTFAALVASSGLEMKTQFTDMMPQDQPKVAEFTRIVKGFTSTTSVMLLIESPEKDAASLVRAASDLASRIDTLYKREPAEEQPESLSTWQSLLLKMGKEVEGARYDSVNLVRRLDATADRSFFRDHGLMVMKEKDLRNFIDMFQSRRLPRLLASINDNFEREYVEDSENLTTLDGETQAIQGLEGIWKFVKKMGEALEPGPHVGTDGADTLAGSFAEAAHAAAERLLLGPEYFLSPDEGMLLMMLQPYSSLDEYDDLVLLADMVMDSIAQVAKSYPELAFGATGTPILIRDEMEALEKDFGWPSLAALLLILAVLVGTFGSFRHPWFAVLTLVVALIWTVGAIQLIFGYMDTMSSSFGIILIGLGIDFGIHFLSGYQEGRDKKLGIEGALRYMYHKVGNGVFTGAATTALVFFTLSLVDFKALTTMGISVGAGITLCYLAMLLFFPSLIAWSQLRRDRKALKSGLSIQTLSYEELAARDGVESAPVAAATIASRGNSKLRWFHFAWLEKLGVVAKKPGLAGGVLALGIALAVLSILGGKRMEFEYNMLELEPEGIPSVIWQDKMMESFELSPDYALFTCPTLDSCRAQVEAMKKAGSRTGLIGRVDAITEFMRPVEEQREENRPIIAAFRRQLQESGGLPTDLDARDVDTLIQQIERLHANVVEIGMLSVMSRGEPNPILKKTRSIVGRTDEESGLLRLAQALRQTGQAPERLAPFQEEAARTLQNILLSMSDTSVVTIESLPEEIRSRYTSPDSGGFLVTVYPKDNVWDEKLLRRFTETTEAVAPAITGTPIINLIFMDLIIEKGRLALIFAAAVILLLLLLDFRSFLQMAMAMIPLAFGALWMVGCMALLGMKFNYTNFMALPLILGIGIDDGVHVLHRYITEGSGSMARVLRTTGRAILLTSITTGIGFGSMAFASHRGIASMGLVLFLGVFTCFLASVLILPAVVGLAERMGFSQGGKTK